MGTTKWNPVQVPPWFPNLRSARHPRCFSYFSSSAPRPEHFGRATRARMCYAATLYWATGNPKWPPKPVCVPGTWADTLRTRTPCLGAGMSCRPRIRLVARDRIQAVRGCSRDAMSIPLRGIFTDHFWGQTCLQGSRRSRMFEVETRVAPPQL